jgi:hypothetical protein
MPSPERLGVSRPGAAPARDWSALGARLQELGATGFHLDRAGQGYRFTLLMPGDRPGLTRRIDAVAATESEAIRLGLEKAGQYGQPGR